MRLLAFLMFLVAILLKVSLFSQNKIVVFELPDELPVRIKLTDQSKVFFIDVYTPDQSKFNYKSVKELIFAENEIDSLESIVNRLLKEESVTNNYYQKQNVIKDQTIAQLNLQIEKQKEMIKLELERNQELSNKIKKNKFNKILDYPSKWINLKTCFIGFGAFYLGSKFK